MDVEVRVHIKQLFLLWNASKNAVFLLVHHFAIQKQMQMLSHLMNMQISLFHKVFFLLGISHLFLLVAVQLPSLWQLQSNVKKCITRSVNGDLKKLSLCSQSTSLMMANMLAVVLQVVSSISISVQMVTVSPAYLLTIQM